jgi:ATP-dependent DNA helicase RecG
VNRAGMGADRICEDLLRLGKGTPIWEADEAHVRLTIPLRTHGAFARLVATEHREGRPLDLDDLIVLRGATDRGLIDRWSGAELLQLPEEECAAKLASLRTRGYLVPQGRGRGTGYRLAPPYAATLRGVSEVARDLPLDSEAVALRVQALLRERGRLTNAEVRRVAGSSRAEVVRLMSALRRQGYAVLRGQGRGSHYAPGPKLAPARRSRKGKKE